MRSALHASREPRGWIRHAAQVKSGCGCWHPSLFNRLLPSNTSIIHRATPVISYKSRLHVLICENTLPTPTYAPLFCSAPVSHSPSPSCTISRRQLAAFATRLPGANTPLTLRVYDQRSTYIIDQGCSSIIRKYPYHFAGTTLAASPTFAAECRPQLSKSNLPQRLTQYKPAQTFRLL